MWPHLKATEGRPYGLRIKLVHPGGEGGGGGGGGGGTANPKAEDVLACKQQCVQKQRGGPVRSRMGSA